MIGDFMLQPNSWVTDKELRREKSKYLYFHSIVHGLLAWLIVFEADFLGHAALLAVVHFGIDLLKLRLQRTATKRLWFLFDQVLHLISITAISMHYLGTPFKMYDIDPRFWILLTGALLLTTPASLIIRNLISIWTPNQNETGESDLNNAGKYIGILERLFVFAFIVTGHFEGVGFLLAAKSIFRFGDLTQAKDRKLTEYVLIGTLISFGMAIAAGMISAYYIE